MSVFYLFLFASASQQAASEGIFSCQLPTRLTMMLLLQYRWFALNDFSVLLSVCILEGFGAKKSKGQGHR